MLNFMLIVVHNDDVANLTFQHVSEVNEADNCACTVLGVIKGSVCALFVNIIRGLLNPFVQWWYLFKDLPYDSPSQCVDHFEI